MSLVPKKVVGLGQVMLRLACEGPLVNFSRVNVNIAGTEFNVLAALATVFNIPTSLVTSLPDHDMGQMVLRTIRGFGVQTADVRMLPFSGTGETNRLPIFFTDELGNTVVDRANGCHPFYPERRPWEQILEGASHLVVSGITLALDPKENTAKLIEAMTVAKSLGCEVVFDVGYRATQWVQHGGLPAFVKACEPMVARCTILTGNASMVNNKFASPVRLLQQHAGLKTIILSDRVEHSRTQHDVSVTIDNRDKRGQSKSHPLALRDRIGGGDAMVGLALGALIKGLDIQEAAELAAAALVHVSSTAGDQLYANLSALQEIASKNVLAKR